MKRVAAAVLGTVAAVVALLQFKTHGTPVATAGGLPAASLSSSESAPSAGTSAPSTAAAPSGAPSTAPSTAAGPSRAPSTAAAPGPAGGTRTVAGDPVDTPYGTVQVQLSLSGAKITNVKFLQLEAFDRRSQEINSDAAPILLQETLRAQRARVDTVSGATYTSEGYEQSVQSALDKAGVR